RLHDKLRRSTDLAVVVHPQFVHVLVGPPQIAQTGIVYATQGRLRSAVPTRIGSRLHSLEVKLEGSECQIAHFDCEPRRLRQPGLFERDVAPESSLDCVALTPLDAIDYEILVL